MGQVIQYGEAWFGPWLFLYSLWQGQASHRSEKTNSPKLSHQFSIDFVQSGFQVSHVASFSSLSMEIYPYVSHKCPFSLMKADGHPPFVFTTHGITEGKMRISWDSLTKEVWMILSTGWVSPVSLWFPLRWGGTGWGVVFHIPLQCDPHGPRGPEPSSICSNGLCPWRYYQ